MKDRLYTFHSVDPVLIQMNDVIIKQKDLSHCYTTWYGIEQNLNVCLKKRLLVYVISYA